MEDGEYYHIMLNDLERLERVHHHIGHREELRRQQERGYSPFISGFRLALSGAIKSGLDRLHVGVSWNEGRRRKSVASVGSL